MILSWFDAPRRVLALVAAACVAMLAFGLYLQHVVGLEPCPMCIVQRYALILVGVVAGVTAYLKSRGAHIAGSALMAILAGLGAFVAARQSWLQWNPPEIASWGNIMSEGRMYFRMLPGLILFPGLFLSLTVLSVNILGDALRDALDPKMVRRI